MTVEVDIANGALDKIGRETIVDLNEDSACANAAKRNYDQSVREALQAFDWGFARVYRATAQIDTVLPVGTAWLFAYQHPADCLAVRRIAKLYPDDPPIPFEVLSLPSGTELAVYTAAEGSVMAYTRSSVPATLYTPTFISAVEWRLASRLVGPLRKGDRALRLDCENAFKAAISHAVTIVANEGAPDPLDATLPPELTARGYLA